MSERLYRWRKGRVLGDRYRLIARIGAGGQGEVWSASDELAGGTVALKILSRLDPGSLVQMRSELSILRLHRLPGIVQLLDEGTYEDVPFLVMELVRGAPFPGRKGRVTWKSIASTTIALVETLTRLHAAGVVHQDIKPANVLVSPEGKPTLLDFGVASDRQLTERIDRKFLLGTLPYMAPERLRGEAATPRSDLYALGILLFKALAGQVPHRAPDTRSLALACLHEPAAPLRSVMSRVPRDVAGLVDLLLHKDPQRRPRSANEVLSILAGLPRPDASEGLWKRLDHTEAARAVADVLRSGRAVDLVGLPGTGRTRCLVAVKAELQREGHRVAFLTPGRTPFSSLAPVIGSLSQHRASRLAAVKAAVATALGGALDEGLVVLVDDANAVDVPSATIIRLCRDRGSLARVLVEPPSDATCVVRIEPLDEVGLEGLFAGPERLFHLRSEPAKRLLESTGGVQSRIIEAADEWLRAGIATWDGELLTVPADLLERLPAPRPAPGRKLSPAPASARPLLRWIRIAGPNATPDVLASCMRRPGWQIEIEIEELVRIGLVHISGECATVTTGAETESEHETPEERRRAHRLLATLLPPGQPARFEHMLAALGPGPPRADTIEMVTEAIVSARLLVETGRLAPSIDRLHEALLLVRRDSAPSRQWSTTLADAEESLLAVWLDLALADGTAPVISRVRHEIHRAATLTASLDSLHRLADASLAFAAGGDRALRMLEAIPAFENLDLERRRQGLRALAARRCSSDIEDDILGEATSWARRQGDPLTLARLEFWRGWWHYRRGRYAEAARCHFEAATHEPWLIARASAKIAAASALLEAFDLGGAGSIVEDAFRDARATGSPFIEARAEWLLRATMYRNHHDSGPDLELVAAIEHLDARDISATVHLTEAAFSYRAGQKDTAARLAQSAAQLWRFVSDTSSYLIARCLALACGELIDAKGEPASLVAQIVACRVPGIGIQALGLLAATPSIRVRVSASDIALLASLVPPDHWNQRMDVLSVDEASSLAHALAARPTRPRGETAHD